MEKFKPESRGFETSRDHSVRRFAAYRIEAHGVVLLLYVIQEIISATM